MYQNAKLNGRTPTTPSNRLKPNITQISLNFSRKKPFLPPAKPFQSYFSLRQTHTNIGVLPSKKRKNPNIKFNRRNFGLKKSKLNLTRLLHKNLKSKKKFADLRMSFRPKRADQGNKILTTERLSQGARQSFGKKNVWTKCKKQCIKNLYSGKESLGDSGFWETSSSNKRKQTTEIKNKKPGHKSSNPEKNPKPSKSKVKSKKEIFRHRRKFSSTKINQWLKPSPLIAKKPIKIEINFPKKPNPEIGPKDLEENKNGDLFEIPSPKSFSEENPENLTEHFKKLDSLEKYGEMANKRIDEDYQRAKLSVGLGKELDLYLPKNENSNNFLCVNIYNRRQSESNLGFLILDYLKRVNNES